MTLEVAADPSDGPLDDPELRQCDEFVSVAAALDLDLPPAGAGDGGSHLRSLIARVADDAFDDREKPARFAQQRFGAITILPTGRKHDDREQPADAAFSLALLEGASPQTNVPHRPVSPVKAMRSYLCA